MKFIVINAKSIEVYDTADFYVVNRGILELMLGPKEIKVHKTNFHIVVQANLICCLKSLSSSSWHLNSVSLAIMHRRPSRVFLIVPDSSSIGLCINEHMDLLHSGTYEHVHVVSSSSFILI